MTPPFPKFDTAIIGGGVIGCAIAWRLAQAGQRVVVIERGAVGQEASWAAGGMLAPLAEADHTGAFFDLCVASRAMYASFADELRAASGIDIEYRTEGTLYLALTDSDEEELEGRWQWQHAAGLNVKKLLAAEVRKLEPLVNETLRWALHFPDDHQVNNRRLMQALHVAAQNAGVEFWLHNEAHKIFTESEAGQVRAVGVGAERNVAIAPTVIIAAGSWSSRFFTGDPPINLPVPVSPLRGQMIALEMPVPALRHVIYSRRGYVIPRFGGHLIVGSTTENVGFDKRVTAHGLSTILQNACEIAPALAAQAITETWAGLRPFGLGGQPILGTDPTVQGLLYATGHFRNGILLTPITAKVISELVLCGTASVDVTPFSPRSFAHLVSKPDKGE